MDIAVAETIMLNGRSGSVVVNIDVAHIATVFAANKSVDIIINVVGILDVVDVDVADVIRKAAVHAVSTHDGMVVEEVNSDMVICAADMFNDVVIIVADGNISAYVVSMHDDAVVIVIVRDDVCIGVDVNCAVT